MAFLSGGEWIRPSSADQLRLVNPADEEIFFTVAEARQDDLESAVAAARNAFDHGPWPQMGVAERAAELRKMGEALDRRAGSLENAWVKQIGVPLAMARGSSAGASAILNYYAALIEEQGVEEVRPSQGMQSRYAVIVKEPVGVVAAVAPWNGPLMTMMMKVAPALAAGCTVIMKPSPESPLEAFLIAEAAEEAGLPAGAVNLVPADREISDLLISHGGVDKVAFTGSTAAGMHIATVCASRMARFTMELGGKSAAILLDDFDPALTGPSLAPQITLMCGQVCINYSRLLVPRSRYSDHVDSLVAAMEAVTVGDPMNAATQMGPLAMDRQRERVEHYIRQGVSEGARIATGGGRPKGLNRGFYFEPTVFADATNDMVIAREEIFGPVTTVIPYDSEAEAIAIANDSDFGLSGGVYTNDTDRAYGIARSVRTGHFTQNGREFDLTNPFGGFKQSGVGREGGPEGIEPYYEIKTVFLPKLPAIL
ncbi:aldehyde dehydrogenase [Parasphingorhabdus sp.]|uniref:aldehyde dehydrogenase n=1 Tax=Parasphingorhabdus sp. TaxID=2709688 RepID=UPI003A8F88A2